jgi:hypothetical protein
LLGEGRLALEHGGARHRAVFLDDQLEHDDRIA